MQSFTTYTDFPYFLHGSLTRNIFKKDNWRRLIGWVFGSMQNTLNTFSEARYFLHVEIMAIFDHHSSIELET